MLQAGVTFLLVLGFLPTAFLKLSGRAPFEGIDSVESSLLARRCVRRRVLQPERESMREAHIHEEPPIAASPALQDHDSEIREARSRATAGRHEGWIAARRYDLDGTLSGQSESTQAI